MAIAASTHAVQPARTREVFSFCSLEWAIDRAFPSDSLSAQNQHSLFLQGNRVVSSKISPPCLLV
jgi:hypothetical protein